MQAGAVLSADESTLDAAGDGLHDDEARPSSQLRRYLREESIKLPRELMRRSAASTAAYLLSAHAWIAFAALAGLYLPGGVPAVLAVGFVVILLAQRSLQTLVHHVSHHLLSKNRAVNDLAGNVLVAGFIGMRIQNYRRVHFVHHAENGSASDPEFIDFSVVQARGGLWRYILHYVSGGEALALVRKYYAPRGGGLPEKRSLFDRLASMAHVAFCQAVLAGLFWLAGAPYLYLVWLYVAASWSPMLSRLRFLVEHPGKDDRTVSTHAPWYEVLFFAPYQFNYHFEHHVWPALPPYRLRQAYRHVAREGYFERHPEYTTSSFVGSLLRESAAR